TFVATESTVANATVVTLDSFTGTATEYGSLADGRYTLKVLSSQVSADGEALAGDNNDTAGGDYVFGDDQSTERLFRLLGAAAGRWCPSTASWCATGAPTGGPPTSGRASAGGSTRSTASASPSSSAATATRSPLRRSTSPSSPGPTTPGSTAPPCAAAATARW